MKSPKLQESHENDGGYDSMAETATAVSSVVMSTISNNNSAAIKKGILWLQRDKIFSRWKERFFIITKDYLQCFKRNSSAVTDMGGFLFKIKLSDIDKVELTDKRGSLTVGLCLKDGGKLLLRRPEDVRDWFQIIKECVASSKERKGMMKSTKEFWSKKQFENSSDSGVRRRGHHYGIRRLGDGLTKEYGFIDMPSTETTTTTTAAAESKQETKKIFQVETGDDDDDITPPPPQYSSGTSCSKDSSGSNKSRDSGIDSIEKPGRPPSSTEQHPEQQQNILNNVTYRRRNVNDSKTKGKWRRSDHIVGSIVDEFPSLWTEREDRGLERKDPHKRYSHYLVPTFQSKPQVTKL